MRQATAALQPGTAGPTPPESVLASFHVPQNACSKVRKRIFMATSAAMAPQSIVAGEVWFHGPPLARGSGLHLAPFLGLLPGLRAQEVDHVLPQQDRVLAIQLGCRNLTRIHQR